MKSPLIMNCDICNDKIKLYEPWYSIHIRSRCTIIHKGELKNNPMRICRNCFHAYKNFLIEREIQENHKRHYQDIKNA